VIRYLDGSRNADVSELYNIGYKHMPGNFYLTCGVTGVGVGCSIHPSENIFN